MQLLQQVSRAPQLGCHPTNADPDTAAAFDGQQETSTALVTANSITSNAQNTVTPDPADSSIKNSEEFFGMTDADDIVQYMMTTLHQCEPRFGIQLHKRLNRMGKSAVWSCFQATVPSTNPPSGTIGSLMRLLDQREQETAIGYKPIAEMYMYMFGIHCRICLQPMTVLHCGPELTPWNDNTYNRS